MSAATGAAPLREALAGATDALRAAGVESPRLDAELLICEASGLSRERLAADPDAGLSPGAGRELAAMVRRRIAREPLAYITGRKWFRDLELAVDRRALIPRPETELLVEVALELRPAAVLDVGTGSGAVALAVADELPDCDVTATDTSPAALALAAENAERLGLAARIAFEAGTLPGRPDAKDFDLVLANLPYVAESELDSLAPEIREYEPREALVSGADGLDAIRTLLAELGTAEGRARAIALEVGEGQASEVVELAMAAGYEQVASRPDFAGIERIVVGR